MRNSPRTCVAPNECAAAVAVVCVLVRLPGGGRGLSQSRGQLCTVCVCVWLCVCGCARVCARARACVQGDPVASIHSRDAVTALCTDHETVPHKHFCLRHSLPHTS